ncbi:TetR/AcrR family transcriptional regulator [Agreia sp. PsM10]|uniref:TetR/AcrR family transcriptional regulator n=1 Tax=Agreia sp. PsM10 TaxID=3030533 RepID=UPI00263BBD4F|nr:TetR/AcrR family transcriptional regulator [Agreia sp. PsM10]MDN4640850.1 TetR/AcrR family transcriptional regulator [Agreia sp. PsM10]
MPSTSPPGPARQDRRKERTRAALIDAAQQLIATGDDAHASIQAITDLADVGFGSFYNYFSSKDELFDAAATSAVDEYLGWLDESLPDDSDPVTRLIESVRHTGRLALERPRTAAILTKRLALIDNEGDPRGERIRADVSAAMTNGGTVADTLEFEILVTAALGAILAVLRRTTSLSPAEISDAADVLAPAILRLLGVEPSTAAP